LGKAKDEKPCRNVLIPVDDALIRFAEDCAMEEWVQGMIKEIYVKRWERKFDKVLKYPYAA